MVHITSNLLHQTQVSDVLAALISSNTSPESKDHPTKENMFSGFALHLLHAENAGSFVGIYAEVQQRVITDPKRKRAKRFDGAIVFQVDGVNHLLLIELKYGRVDAAAALAQIQEEEEYVPRAIEFLKETHKLDVLASNVHCINMRMHQYRDGQACVVEVKSAKYSDME